MESDQDNHDFVWVLAAVFAGMSSYFFAKSRATSGSDKPLFDDNVPLQDTSKKRQLNQLRQQLHQEQENFEIAEKKFNNEIEYLNGQIERIQNSEKQDADTDLLMKEMEEEIKEEDLLGNVEENLIGLDIQDELREIDN